MNGNSQTRCPYTLKRLDDLIKINEEHVFPEAIGGPQSFHVKADEGSNTTFGHTTDARFVNSKFIELWRAIFGIKGRLGREPRCSRAIRLSSLRSEAAPTQKGEYVPYEKVQS